MSFFQRSLERAGLHHARHLCSHIHVAHGNLGYVHFLNWQSSFGDRWLLLWLQHHDSDTAGLWPHDGSEFGYGHDAYCSYEHHWRCGDNLLPVPCRNTCIFSGNNQNLCFWRIVCLKWGQIVTWQKVSILFTLIAVLNQELWCWALFVISKVPWIGLCCIFCSNTSKFWFGLVGIMQIVTVLDCPGKFILQIQEI